LYTWVQSSTKTVRHLVDVVVCVSNPSLSVLCLTAAHAICVYGNRKPISMEVYLLQCYLARVCYLLPLEWEKCSN